ncbi:AfsR/SARP family transcriptional regulator [Actinokineospora spheciospongiae]|uniref:AfsR/SARP family transcriptional regulator n=1 Tax=Actinokineospora spheciospongiae TaxID=909613 RepID=UPI0004B923AF|nr:BTAD domain-containing putative transcriptional regulator [Actinokineospora spheciospongiae]PWW66976.1 DNA-binding SARP family transcriptional activator [Actinokineospora spheciospongiae]
MATQSPESHADCPRLRLLGGFGLTVGETAVPVVPGAQRLLAYLVLHAEPVSRAAAARSLWPGATPTRASACLRSTLWRLMKWQLPLVTTAGDTLAAHRAVSVDVWTVRALAHEPCDHGIPGPEVPSGLLGGELLPGWDEPWVAQEREWFRQVRLRTLEMLSERYRRAGDLYLAHKTAVAAVRVDPLRESAHRALVELHLADGNPAEAVRQFHHYRALVRRELGLDPSPAISGLVHHLVAERPRPVSVAGNARSLN